MPRSWRVRASSVGAGSQPERAERRREHLGHFGPQANQRVAFDQPSGRAARSRAPATPRGPARRATCGRARAGRPRARARRAPMPSRSSTSENRSSGSSTPAVEQAVAPLARIRHPVEALAAGIEHDERIGRHVERRGVAVEEQRPRLRGRTRVHPRPHRDRPALRGVGVLVAEALLGDRHRVAVARAR